MSDDRNEEGKDATPNDGATDEPKRSTSDAGFMGMQRTPEREEDDRNRADETESGREGADEPEAGRDLPPDNVRRLPPLPPGDGGGRDGGAGEEPSPDGEERPPPNELTPSKIATLVANKNFIVGLIGYPTAGKTSFLNRLKHTYEHFRNEDRRRFAIWPSYDTGPVRQTAIPTYHYFTRVGGNAARKAASGDDALSHEDFVLFDLPGERFRIAFEEAGLAGPRSQELNDAIAACDALILLLPSDLVVGSRGKGGDIFRSQLEAAEQEHDEIEDEIAALRREGDAAGARRTADAAAARTGREVGIASLRERIDALDAEPADPEKDAEISRLEAELADEERRAARAVDNAARRNAREAARISEGIAPRAERLAELDTLIATLSARLANAADLQQVGEAVAANRRKLDTFVAHINRMVEKVVLQKGLGKSAAEVEAMSEEDRNAAIKKISAVAYTPLIYVAVSKADEVLSERSPVTPLRPTIPLGQIDGAIGRQDLDEHPAHVVKCCEPDIYRGITTVFPWFKFDFLTAFEGQRKTQYAYEEPPQPNAPPEMLDYELPDYGVISVVNWLEFAKRRADESKRFLLRRGLGALWSAPKTELKLAHRAGIYDSKYDSRLSRRLRWLFFHPRGAGAWFLTALAAVLILGLVTTGVGRAGLQKITGSSGTYPIQVQPRYASEAERLRRSDLAFATGVVTGDVRPWASIPETDEVFSVPRSRDALRRQFEDVLETVRRFPNANSIARLTELQAEMNREYGSSNAADLYRQRFFIPYHTGYVQLRMRDFDGAATTFQEALRLLQGVTPPANSASARARLLSARITVNYALALALMQKRSPDLAAAKQHMDAAIQLLLRLGTTEPRTLLTSQSAGIFFPFEERRTPIVLNSAAIWSDALVLYIRDFDFARDTATDSAFALHFQELNRHVGSFENGSRLSLNYMIAGALLGRPPLELPFAPEDFDASVRTTVQLARSAAGDIVSLTDSDVWGYDRRLRQTFVRGVSEEVDRVLYDATSNLRESADSTFLKSVAGEIVATERERLPADRRDRLLSTFGSYMPGGDFMMLANDFAPFGSGLGWAIPILLLLLLLRLWFLYGGARQTFAALFLSGHRADRQAKAAVPEKSDATGGTDI